MFARFQRPEQVLSRFLHAEELLIRAHHYDARAINLVCAGYAQGIGGFPKDRRLAVAAMEKSRRQMFTSRCLPDVYRGLEERC